MADQNGNNTSIPLDSKIIDSLEEIEFIEKELKKNEPKFKNKNLRLKLFYRMTRDGKDEKYFFDKCEGIVNNLIVIKTKLGYKFGGISFGPWHVRKWTRDAKSFCFSLDLKKIYNAVENKETHYLVGLPYFYGNYAGDSQMIQLFYSKKNDIVNGLCGTKNIGSFIGQEKDYEINGGYSGFEVLEWEAFQMIFI